MNSLQGPLQYVIELKIKKPASEKVGFIIPYYATSTTPLSRFLSGQEALRRPVARGLPFSMARHCYTPAILQAVKRKKVTFSVYLLLLHPLHSMNDYLRYGLALSSFLSPGPLFLRIQTDPSVSSGKTAGDGKSFFDDPSESRHIDEVIDRFLAGKENERSLLCLVHQFQ